MRFLVADVTTTSVTDPKFGGMYTNIIRIETAKQ